MALGKSHIASFRQLFAWRKFQELWKVYAASLANAVLIHRIRLFLEVADQYGTTPPGNIPAQTRANRLYRHALRRMQPFANEWQLDLNVQDHAAPGKQAHGAFDRLTLPRRQFWRAILAYTLTALMGVGAIIMLLSIFSTSVRSWAFPPDLATGRPWRVSDTVPPHPKSGLMPKPGDEASATKSFFFHTQEVEHPWVEIDLGEKKRVSRVQVRNRRDCCFERALPLEIHLSIDGMKWETVARRRGTFTTWEAQFPSYTARYVRLTTARRTMLHLASVAVY